VLQTVAANELQDCYIRPLVYLAEGGWNLCLDNGVPHVGIAAWKWEAYLGQEALERGVRANTSSFTAASRECHDDEGEDLRKLCEFGAGKDGIRPARVR
jgi:branched-subunit amino acid aminotransferase/4-amino-4-deoxychorismate lyase